VRFAEVRLAVLRLALLRFVVLRLAVLRFAVLRVAALRLAGLRLVAFFPLDFRETADFFADEAFFALAFFEDEAALRVPLCAFADLRVDDFFAEDAFFAPLDDPTARRLDAFFDEDFFEAERAVVRLTSLLKRLPFSSARSIASPLRSNHSKNSSHSIASSVSSPL
jgi:hypothetical protein